MRTARNAPSRSSDASGRTQLAPAIDVTDGCSGSTPLTSTPVALDAGRRAGRASGSGPPAHSPTLISPTLAGLLSPEHSSRGAPIARARRLRSAGVTTPARAINPVVLIVQVLRRAGTPAGHSVRT